MKPFVPGILAMAALVVLSNILVQYPIGPYLTWGAFTYPFTFLVNEVVNRFHGPAAARRVVYWGFATGLFCSVIGTQIVLETGPIVTGRIALGSGLAFLCAQLLDTALFNRLRQGLWWRAPLFASLAAAVLDTAIFFTIAFSATLAWIEPANDVTWAAATVPLLGIGYGVPLWVSLGTADLIVKVLVDLIALVPFRLALARYAKNNA